MRLLYLSDIRFPMERANGIQTAHTCHALARRGVEVHLVVRRHGLQSEGVADQTDASELSDASDAFAFYGLEALENLNLERLRARSRWGFLARALLFLSRGRGRWDAILTRDLVLAEMAIATKPLHSLPVFYEAHTVASVFAEERAELYSGHGSVSMSKLSRLDRRERLVCREASGLVTITESLREQLASRHGALAPTLVARDGCRGPERPQPAVSGGLPKRAFYVGQLYPWKGVDVLIEAARQLDPSMIEIVIVGGLPPEPDLDRVKTLAKTAGVEARVRFTGYVRPDGIEDATREADIFVVPLLDSATARWFTSPMKLFEAMASGRPIVASSLPSVREVLTHEKNALLVAPGDAEALAKALERLAKDEELASSLAARALEDVAQYTWERRAELLHEFLQERVESEK
jgi:glycosyltransferase involved in cell wall biosynthesis